MAKPEKLLEAIERQARDGAVDIETRSGLAKGTYTKLLNGSLKMRVHHLMSLCRALGISLSSLFWSAYGVDEGSARMADLFLRFLRPELERLLRPDGSFSSAERMAKRFYQMQVEE